MKIPFNIAVLTLLTSGTTWAGVVVDHQPHPTGGPASDTSLIDPISPLTSQLAADDFVLAEDATIRRIVWWGFYGSTFTSPAEQPPPSQEFRIRFYEPRDSDGLPGNIFFEETIADPAFEATGRIIVDGAGPDEYRYEADLPTPVDLLAAQPYWLEIVQVGVPDSYFRWEFSIEEQSGLATNNANFPNWHYSFAGADTSFQLSTIPEPGSILLFGSMLTVTLFRRSRRKEAPGGCFNR